MARPLVTDFAISTLGATISTAGALSFTVAAGTGNKFPDPSTSPQPNGRFVVAIDNELVLCSARSSDTFTVWSDSAGHTGRGYSGTTATAHTLGANVVLAFPSTHFNQIWGALADTYNPDVPIPARGSYSNGLWNYRIASAPGTYDEEFEAPYTGWNTPWSWSPRPTSIVAPDGSTGTDPGMTASWGTTLKSQLFMQRADNNTEKWYLWRPYAPGTGSWTVRAKVGHAATYVAESTEFGMGVSSQANPTAGGGTAVALAHSVSNINTVTIVGHSTSYTAQSPMWIVGHSTAISGGIDRWAPYRGERYIQISYDGIYRFATSLDGINFQEITSLGLAAFTPASLYFYWSVLNPQFPTKETTTIDWVRTF